MFRNWEGNKKKKGSIRQAECVLSPVSTISSSVYSSEATASSYVVSPGDFRMSQLIGNETLPNSSEPWSDLESFDIIPENLDIDKFFRYLDDSLTATSQGTIRSVPNVAPNPTEFHNVEIQNKKNLIDAIFSDGSHTPPAISRMLITNIAMKPSRAFDETFLYNSVLALGALTLAKRDLVAMHATPINEHQTRPPAVASEAFKYYQKARNLIPNILETPTRDGFKGLVLISNFMSILLTLEAQMFISFNALQVGVSIGLDSVSKFAAGSEEFGLVIAFWELWSTACMLSSFHGRFPPVRRDEITTTLDLNMKKSHEEQFFRLRVGFAELHCQLSKMHNQRSAELDSKFETLSLTLMELEERYLADKLDFHRNELLVLELKCWRAQAAMLYHLPDLDQKRNTRSFVEAKTILRELWVYYNPKIFQGSHLLKTLDWNFTTPLRTATISICLALTVITKHIKAVDYLSFEMYEYQLSRKLLDGLVAIMPINRYLITDLDHLRGSNR